MRLVPAILATQRYDIYKLKLVEALAPIEISPGKVASLGDLAQLPLRLRRSNAEGDRSKNGGKGSAAREALDVWDIPSCSSRVAIVGRRGSGKSVLLRYMALMVASDRIPAALEQAAPFRRPSSKAASFIPFYIDLADWSAQDVPLATYFERLCDGLDFARAAGFIEQRLEAGEAIILLDGFEAIPADKREWARKQITLLSEQTHGLNQIIVTADRKSAVEGLAGFSPLELMSLDAEAISAAVKQRFSDNPAQASALLGAIDWSPRLQSLVSVPLYLALVTSAHEARGSELRTCKLYAACVDALRQDALRRARTAGESAALAPPLLNSVQAIAYDLHTSRRLSLPEPDVARAIRSGLAPTLSPTECENVVRGMLDAGLMLTHEDETVGFGHLAIQEYLAACEMRDRGEAALPLEHLDDDWWEEVTLILSGLTNDPAAIAAIAGDETSPLERVVLAARCLSEATLEPAKHSELRRGIILQLGPAFAGDNPAAWQLAGSAIASIEHNPIPRAFLDLIRSSDADLCALAALGLGRVGQEGWATASLTEALAATQPNVRANAARALGQLGSTGAVSNLVELLGDQPEVSQEAARALGRLQVAAIRPCIRALRSGEEAAQEMAAKALGYIGEPAVSPLLEIALNQRLEKPLRQRALEALAAIGSQKPIAPLVEMLYDHDGDLGTAAARALGAVGAPAVEPLLNALTQRARQGVDATPQIIIALVSIGDAAVRSLLTALDDPEPEVRDAAERALIGIGPSVSEPAISALRQSSAAAQRRLARILGEIGDGQTLQAMIELLPGSEPTVQMRIVQALGQIGESRAVLPLLEIVRDSEMSDVIRREAIRSLGSIGDSSSVEPIAAALEDPQLRDAAASALSQLGESAVEELLRSYYDEADEKSRELVLEALGRIGRHGASGAKTMGDVAYTLHRLITGYGSYDDTELLDLLRELVWWAPGEELYRSFSTMLDLLKIESLEQAPRYGELLAWARERSTWFRPPLGEILVGLGDVAENVKLYQARRSAAGNEAFVSSVNKMNQVQSAAEKSLAEFEKGVFVPVIQHWRSLLDDAIRETRGKADLKIDTLNKQILLDNPMGIAPVVFDLRNMGDSVARNLVVTLEINNSAGARIVGASVERLAPLGSGMHQEVQFDIQRLSSDDVSLALDVAYDDDERTGHKTPYTSMIHFGMIGKYVPIPASPYIPGRPIKTPKMFFGRTDTLNWIARNLGGAYQQNVLVLHGERRVGKTSVLYQLQNEPPTPRHLCIFFSFELAAPNSIGKLLYDIAYAVHRGLASHRINIPRPEREDYAQYPEDHFQRFCDDMSQRLGDKVVVLMMDEFGILIEKVREGALPGDILHFFRGISQDQDALTFIFVGAYLLQSLLRDEKSVLFNIAQVHKIEYLKPDEAEELIRRPVAGYIDYDALVVQRIIEVTACHPYFIQVICDELVKLAQQGEKNYLSLADLEMALLKIVQDAGGQIETSIYRHLSGEAQSVLAALAELTDAQTVFVTPDRIANILQTYDLALPSNDLMSALRELCDRDLAEEERVGQRLAYGCKMRLTQRWLEANEMLMRLREERSL